jgi:UrcA family protein
MHKTLTAIAAFATILTTAPALATGQDGRTASIRIDDIDLSSPAGVRLLDRRVAAAKEAVCGSYMNARDGREDRITACRAAVDRQLEPQLAALRARNQLALR